MGPNLFKAQRLLTFAALLAVYPCFATLKAQNDVDAKLAELRAHYDSLISGMKASYEEKLAELRGEVSLLRRDVSIAPRNPELSSALEESIAAIERQGLGSPAQSTIFDNRFNPAISLIGDFVFSVSGKDDSFDLLDRFTLRDVELGIVGRVDPYLAYYAYIHFDEEEVELEEAYGIADNWLPGTFSLKFGRYNVDFGKQSPVHEHELPYVDKPGVLQEYLDGALRGTGLELHHWFGMGDAAVSRWSIGIVNSPDGDAHPILGPIAGEDLHEEGEGAFGTRDLDNFALNGRFTSIFDLSENSTLQLGASILWAPEVAEFEDDGTGVFERIDREKLSAGIDVTFKWVDPSDGEGLTLGFEGLYNDQEFHDEDTETIFREDALGFYVFGEYFFNKNWSAGASFDYFERAVDSDADWLDVGAFVTWRINEFNRLRAEVRYIDDELGDDEYTTLLIQWTTILGSHGHGLEW